MIVSGILDQSFQRTDDRRLDLVNIIGHPRNKIALPSFRKIADRQGKYLGIDIIAQESDRRAPDRRGDIRRPVIKEVLQESADDDQQANDDQQGRFVICWDIQQEHLSTRRWHCVFSVTCLAAAAVFEKGYPEKGSACPRDQPEYDGKDVKDHVYHQLAPVPGQILKNHREFLHAVAVDLGAKLVLGYNKER
jgi:hypothetical protein